MSKIIQRQLVFIVGCFVLLFSYAYSQSKPLNITQPVVRTDDSERVENSVVRRDWIRSLLVDSVGSSEYLLKQSDLLSNQLVDENLPVPTMMVQDLYSLIQVTAREKQEYYQDNIELFGGRTIEMSEDTLVSLVKIDKIRALLNEPSKLKQTWKNHRYNGASNGL